MAEITFATNPSPGSGWSKLADEPYKRLLSLDGGTYLVDDNLVVEMRTTDGLLLKVDLERPIEEGDFRVFHCSTEADGVPDLFFLIHPDRATYTLRGLGADSVKVTFRIYGSTREPRVV